MRIFLFLILCLFHSISFATEIDEEKLSNIATQKSWLKLLHLEKHALNFGSYKSAILDKNFYLDSEGSRNPLSELIATIDAMDKPVTSENLHVRCIYPARVKWIESTLGLSSNFDLIKHCPLYSKWRYEKKVNSISVILATGYLKNPASYYGHTFIKFNTDGANKSKDLINATVNYGAIDTKADHPILYIVKSLVGGYDAAFRKVDFYHHEQVYTENENRDLWDFELNLSQYEVDFILDHAWEILDKKYTYHFFKENCAFRMIELIEILPEVDVTSKYDLFTIPQMLIQNLSEIQYKGSSLIKSKKYYPSRQSRFYTKYKSLSDQEQKAFKGLVLSHMNDSDSQFSSQSKDSQQKILDTVIDYYSFTEDSKSKQVVQQNPDYLKALALRFKLPTSSQEKKYVPDHSPEEGRPASLFQIGHLQTHKINNATFLRFRPAYYDQLDSDHSHVKNSSLVMGDAQVVIANNSIKLQNLDIFAVESANPGLTGLEGDKGYAWKAKLGLEQYNVGCSSCLVPRLQGDYGYGINLLDGFYLAAYFGGGLQNDRFERKDVFLRASLEAILRPHEKFGLKVNVEERLNFKNNDDEYYIRTEFRYALSRDFDLRSNYQYQSGIDSSHMFQVGFGSYW